MMPEEVAKLAQEQAERVRLMTNLELWQKMVGSISREYYTDDLYLAEREFEWRLRKIGFLPALPQKEGA